ncbi:DUF2283 domain-containing protein [Candidatus Woesebacteria bacterium]|nr:DUF2283 domain-containing protein [Candidatus Woesebacteria bacterium]
MKVKYYKDDDILVMKFSDKPIDYAEESDWVIVHFDKDDKPVRIEILDAKRFLTQTNKALPVEVKKEYFSQSAA